MSFPRFLFLIVLLAFFHVSDAQQVLPKKHLIINTYPDSTTLYLDGTKIGNSPLKVDVSISKNHLIKALKVGYFDKVKVIKSSNTNMYQHIFIILKPKGDKPSVVLVPGGQFYMGGKLSYSRNKKRSKIEKKKLEQYNNQLPEHLVQLDSFYITKDEITNSQYCQFLTALGVTRRGYWRGQMLIDLTSPGTNIEYSDKTFYSKKGKKTYPVTNVTWTGASLYCKWLGGRLPTEAEWEYAAGGGKHRSPFQYSGSNNLNDVGWYSQNSGGKIHDVGKKKPNGLGIYDMSGNVMEWVYDWYGENYYRKQNRTNPKGPKRGRYKIARGGAWNRSQMLSKIKTRYLLDPSYSNSNLGFRCAFNFKVISTNKNK